MVFSGSSGEYSLYTCKLGLDHFATDVSLTFPIGYKMNFSYITVKGFKYFNINTSYIIYNMSLQTAGSRSNTLCLLFLFSLLARNRFETAGKI
jgi:hypothetical protein